MILRQVLLSCFVVLLVGQMILGPVLLRLITNPNSEGLLDVWGHMHYGQVSVTLAKMNYNMKKRPGNSFISVAIL